MITILIMIMLLCIITIALDIELFSLRRQLTILKSQQKPVACDCFDKLIVVTTIFVPEGQMWLNPNDLYALFYSRGK